MALVKQPVPLNFIRGLDTKTDDKQLDIGYFLDLRNTVFTASKRLTKRNGFKNVTALPNAKQTTLTTLNDNLIATGSNLYAYSKDTNEWFNKGLIQPVQLSTASLLRCSTTQTKQDAATASNGLTCVSYVDNSIAYYQISDSITGQQVISRQTLPSSARNPKVFILGVYFIITFTINTGPSLQYIAIPTATPDSPKAAATIAATLASTTTGYDGYVANDNLFLAWGGATTTVRITYMTQSLAVAAPVTIASSTADLVSVTVDTSMQVVWVSYWSATSGNNGFTTAYSYILGQLMAPTQIITSTVISQITSIPTSPTLKVFYEVTNNYSYTDSTSNNMRSDFIDSIVVTRPGSGTGAGTVSSPVVVLRSVGLASKAFAISGKNYLFVVYGCLSNTNPDDNSNQSTYFLIDDSGNVYARLAYSNADGYNNTVVLPSVSTQNGTMFYPYLAADFLTTVNKGTNLPSGTPTNAIYTQYGINQASFTINTTGQYSSEIAGALHLTGGQLWEYDGVKPVEHGFQVWPENVVGANTALAGPAVPIGQYYYIFTYEWTDNQGNLHRSAPSIPVFVNVAAAVGVNRMHVPTLRLTYKTAPNPVRIVGYRWSVAQQIYYQFTSITAPTLNNPAVDSVTIDDNKSDAQILGQTPLYTNGGVIENIAAPASIASALYRNRLFLVDAEDRNLLWYSKQVIENTPVEMSDLFTIYVAPTSGAQGSTGLITAISAMDDKLIVFKKDAIYYVTGNGPDNTGANNDFSDPVFVTSSVGCSNPSSIVLMPQGIMFQSDKGIWLLGRDLSTNYIGDSVEAFNNETIVSADSIPSTNQIRFVLANSQTLMYDYYFKQWGVHTNISAIDSTLYQGYQTYLNSYGQVFQETPNYYLDGSKPVLISFTTSWINVAGLQGYERFYFGNLLGTYFSPFILNVSLAYDYNPSAVQSIQVTPDNFSEPWGGEALWGSGGPWGGPGNVFSSRLFPEKQKCQSFQVSISEVYDASLGQAPGQGLNLSGLALVVGVKKGWRTQSARKSFG